MTNIISFKSTRENFNKELHGLKCNTLREMNSDDERFESIVEMEMSKDYGIVEITCDNFSFKRRIKDITFWKKYVIISWDNPDIIKKVINYLYELREDAEKKKASICDEDGDCSLEYFIDGMVNVIKDIDTQIQPLKNEGNK